MQVRAVEDLWIPLCIFPYRYIVAIGKYPYIIDVIIILFVITCHSIDTI